MNTYIVLSHGKGRRLSCLFEAADDRRAVIMFMSIECGCGHLTLHRYVGMFSTAGPTLADNGHMAPCAGECVNACTVPRTGCMH